MHFRLLVSFPVALLLVGVALASASSLVSAFERGQAAGPPPPIEVQRFESTCDILRRELHALSHAVSPCELPPDCQGSPLLCPFTQDARIEREYERLRDALHEQCGLPRSLVDFAWDASDAWDAGEQVDGAEHCELAHDGFEAAVRGEAKPTSYSF